MIRQRAQGYNRDVPRSVMIALPSDRAARLVEELAGFDGMLTLSRQQQVSIHPPGDVVTVEVLDRSTPALFALLSRHGAGRDDTVSLTSSEPTGMVSSSSAAALASDPASSSFEEVETMLEREATMGANKVAAMAAAGAVATVGLLTNSVHLVLGAMVIAPGFEPFLKVALRVAGRGRSFPRGFYDICAGWAALVVGATLTALALRVLGISADSVSGGYLAAGELISYWRDITATATLVAVIGGAAGALLIVANRPVLTAGVMIALALVPGATLLGVAIAEGDLGLAADGAARWAHDAAIVTVVGAAVFALYRARRGRGLGTSNVA